MQIAIFTSRASETEFYTLLSRNRQIQLKELCSKIPRKMVYRYLTQLRSIQDSAGIDIISSRAGLCPRTGLPNKVISINRQVTVNRFPEDRALILLR